MNSCRPWPIAVRSFANGLPVAGGGGWPPGTGPTAVVAGGIAPLGVTSGGLDAHAATSAISSAAPHVEAKVLAFIAAALQRRSGCAGSRDAGERSRDRSRRAAPHQSCER